MQTFVPYADFKQSAKVLDRTRLGKQRVENLQILKALIDPKYGWQNHPAVKMWRNHRGALIKYQRAICEEWTSRGYKDTCLEKSILLAGDWEQSEWELPAWVGNEQVHLSHRSNLLRKAPEHYAMLFEQGLSDNLPYYWPTDEMEQ
jgi:Pyrimidine dimer DNA glycosylase